VNEPSQPDTVMSPADDTINSNRDMDEDLEGIESIT
jgi:hypothetical protein